MLRRFSLVFIQMPILFEKKCFFIKAIFYFSIGIWFSFFTLPKEAYSKALLSPCGALLAESQISSAVASPLNIKGNSVILFKKPRLERTQYLNGQKIYYRSVGEFQVGSNPKINAIIQKLEPLGGKVVLVELRDKKGAEIITSGGSFFRVDSNGSPYIGMTEKAPIEHWEHEYAHFLDWLALREKILKEMNVEITQEREGVLGFFKRMRLHRNFKKASKQADSYFSRDPRGILYTEKEAVAREAEYFRTPQELIAIAGENASEIDETSFRITYPYWRALRKLLDRAVRPDSPALEFLSTNPVSIEEVESLFIEMIQTQMGREWELQIELAKLKSKPLLSPVDFFGGNHTTKYTDYNNRWRHYLFNKGFKCCSIGFVSEQNWILEVYMRTYDRALDGFIKQLSLRT